MYNKKCKNVHRYEIKLPLNTCKSLILIIIFDEGVNVIRKKKSKQGYKATRLASRTDGLASSSKQLMFLITRKSPNKRK